MQYLQPNTTLQGGKYRIERVLGQGGFGITYLAEQLTLNRYVAIKELFIGGSGQAINDRQGNMVVVTNSANQASFKQQLDKFKKEALRLANLNHPNLVKVHDLFEENGTAYYVMDYIEGESLRTKLNREGTLSENLVLKYLQQLLPALETAHKQSIWHLDIKPENIMVDKHGNAYLIDFGASKHVEPNSALTTSLALAYTPGYCPPELLDLSNESSEYYIQAIKDIGPWSDIYALGATMYNLLTDSIPPSKRRLEKEGRNAFQFPTNLSSSTKDLIVSMMKPNKEDRPQSVKDIIFSLNNMPKEQGREHVVSDSQDTIWASDSSENDTSIELLIQRASLGDATAQNELGECYYYGKGVGVDKHKAFEWYKKSAEQGYASAQCNLGYCYEKGIGVDVNKHKAFEWYKKSAEQGNASAQYNLGYCYRNGIGVDVDIQRAFEWYKKSAEQGNGKAQKCLEELSRNKKGKAENSSSSEEIVLKEEPGDWSKVLYFIISAGFFYPLILVKYGWSGWTILLFAYGGACLLYGLYKILNIGLRRYNFLVILVFLAFVVWQDPFKDILSSSQSPQNTTPIDTSLVDTSQVDSHF